MNLHVVFHKIPEGWAGSYDNIDEQNKLIEIDPTLGEKKRFQSPFHEFTHWIIDYYKEKFNWHTGWPTKLKQNDKEDIICYEVDEEVWGILSKYLKKR